MNSDRADQTNEKSRSFPFFQVAAGIPAVAYFTSQAWNYDPGSWTGTGFAVANGVVAAMIAIGTGERLAGFSQQKLPEVWDAFMQMPLAKGLAAAKPLSVLRYIGVGVTGLAAMGLAKPLSEDISNPALWGSGIVGAALLVAFYTGLYGVEALQKKGVIPMEVDVPQPVRVESRRGPR